VFEETREKSDIYISFKGHCLPHGGQPSPWGGHSPAVGVSPNHRTKRHSSPISAASKGNYCRLLLQESLQQQPTVGPRLSAHPSPQGAIAYPAATPQRIKYICIYINVYLYIFNIYMYISFLFRAARPVVASACGPYRCGPGLSVGGTTGATASPALAHNMPNI